MLVLESFSLLEVLIINLSFGKSNKIMIVEYKEYAKLIKLLQDGFMRETSVGFLPDIIKTFEA